jgi:acyl carrier protein
MGDPDMNLAVREKILAIIAEQALVDVSDIPDDVPLADLGLDSLAMVEIIFAIEEAFDIQIPFNANHVGPADIDLSSVSSVVDSVQGLLARKAA